MDSPDCCETGLRQGTANRDLRFTIGWIAWDKVMCVLSKSVHTSSVVPGRGTILNGMRNVHEKDKS